MLLADVLSNLSIHRCFGCILRLSHLFIELTHVQNHLIDGNSMDLPFTGTPLTGGCGTLPLPPPLCLPLGLLGVFLNRLHLWRVLIQNQIMRNIVMSARWRDQIHATLIIVIMVIWIQIAYTCVLSFHAILTKNGRCIPNTL